MEKKETHKRAICIGQKYNETVVAVFFSPIYEIKYS